MQEDVCLSGWASHDSQAGSQTKISRLQGITALAFCCRSRHSRTHSAIQRLMGHCQGPSRAAVHNHITAMLTPSEAYFASATPWVEEVAPSSLPVAVVVVQHEDLLGQVEEEALGVPVRRT